MNQLHPPKQKSKTISGKTNSISASNRFAKNGFALKSSPTNAAFNSPRGCSRV